MTIKTIERSLSREYNVLGLKEWKGARMVAEINETEDEYECGKELERKVERQISHGYSADWNSQTGILNLHQPIQAPPPVIDRKAIERLEILIDDAKSPEELEIYKDDAEKHGLYGHYLMRAQNFKQ